MSAPSSEDTHPLHYRASKVSWATAEFAARPPALILSAFLYSLLACLTLALLYSAFLEVPISVGARGILVTERSALPILAPVTGRVLVLRARDNQALKKGDVLFITENQITDAQYRQVKSLLASLRQSVDEDKRQACNKECHARLGRISLQAAAIQLSGGLRPPFVDIQDTLREYLSHRNDLLNISRLTAEQQREIASAEAKITAVKSRRAARMLAVEIEQLRSKIGVLRHQIAERRHSIESEIQQARDRLEVRLGTFLTAVDEFRSQQTVVAPEDGVVSHLAISGPGQMLSAGEKLLELIPSRSPLIAELTVQNRDIAKIAVGQRVRMKLEAFSEADYGYLDGTISELPAGIQVESGENAPLYRVKATLQSQAFERDGHRYPFRIGMSLSAAIVVRKRSLLRLALNEVFRIKEAVVAN